MAIKFHKNPTVFRELTGSNKRTVITNPNAPFIFAEEKL